MAILHVFETLIKKFLVAGRAGLHRTTIGQMEAGKIQPTLLTLLKIARALECDLGKIITRAEKGG